MSLSPNQHEGIFFCWEHDAVWCECFQRWCAACPWHLHPLTTCGISLIPPPWLMLQQCSFGIERPPCRLPSDSFRNSLRKHVLPDSLRHGLISLTGGETRGSKVKKVKNKVLIFDVFGRRCWCAWLRVEGKEDSGVRASQNASTAWWCNGVKRH